jgi:hypothetical protein
MNQSIMNEFSHYVAFRYDSLKVEEGKVEEETSRHRALDILRNNRLWFPSPSDFSDIFDCNPERKYTPGQEGKDFHGLLNIHLEKISKNATPEQMTDPNYFSEVVIEGARKINEMALAMQMEFVRQSGVKCFCGKKGGTITNNLMWGNHADAHKGICIGFKVAPPFFEKLHPVRYVKARMPVPLYPNESHKEDMFWWTFLQKGEDFTYEDEYRIVIQGGANMYHPFDKEFLTELYFGVKTADEDRKEVIEILRAGQYPHVQLFNMEPKPSEGICIAKPYGEVFSGKVILTISA